MDALMPLTSIGRSLRRSFLRELQGSCCFASATPMRCRKWLPDAPLREASPSSGAASSANGRADKRTDPGSALFLDETIAWRGSRVHRTSRQRRVGDRRRSAIHLHGLGEILVDADAAGVASCRRRRRRGIETPLADHDASSPVYPLLRPRCCAAIRLDAAFAPFEAL